MILLDNSPTEGGGGVTQRPPIQPVPLRVDMPKDPPKEVLERTFSADPKLVTSETSRVVSGDEGVIQVKPAAPTKVETGTEGLPFIKPEDIKGDEKKEEVKVEKAVEKVKDFTSILKAPKKEGETEEVKKEEPKAVEEAKKEVPKVKQITPVKTEEDKSHFDYAGFSDQEVLYLKNMSRQSREYAAKLIKDNKDLAKLKDATWLQHPQAHTLSPEYQQTSFLANKAAKEGEYWKSQLILARQGKEVTELKGWNENGTPQLGATVKPTEEIEIELQRAMNNCYAVKDKAEADLQQIPQKFKGIVENDSKLIQQERRARFAWAEKPELLDYTVMTDDGQEKSVKTIREDLISLFPPYLRNHPALDVAADLMVSLVIQSAQLREAQQTTKVAETRVEEVKRGEPGSIIKPAKAEDTAVNGSPKVFSLEGMPR